MTTIERVSEPLFETAPEGVELDDFTPTGRLETARRTLVIVSYNIRYAVGSFLITGSIGRRLGLRRPKRRPLLVERHLESAALALSNGVRLPVADIVALQEADKRTMRAGGHDVARELASRLRMRYARAAAETPHDEEPKSKQWYLDFEEHMEAGEEGDTGVAILSSLPFAGVARIDLPWSDCAWRPKLALAARVESQGRALHVFNSHIDPHATIEGQLEQHGAILSMTRDLQGAVVLLGDFNTLSKRSCLEMRRLLESHGFTTPFATGEATWRAGLIRLHTDWIFVRGAKVKRCGVARGLSVSDHWPVWAEVELTEEA
ncbi:MAG TPA: endonuclease/exonuclease/phosphatase family protein [Pyrinomonadaceae bacterium]|nr:endonuclease/exonuclease/phosphatase family protein [Pyrinomonadaceae bacterium]